MPVMPVNAGDIGVARIEGNYDGGSIVKHLASGRRFVVYACNKDEKKVIAFSYGGLHTLRKTQNIAVVIFALLAGAVTATCTASVASITLTTCTAIGAALIVLGIGLTLVWWLNDYDPAIQREARNKAILMGKIQSDNLTSPAEKREMFARSVVGVHLHEKVNDFHYLASRGDFTAQEENYFNQLIIPQNEELRALEIEFTNRLTPSVAIYEQTVAQARTNYNHAPAVQLKRVADTMYTTASIYNSVAAKRDSRFVNSLLIEGAHVGATVLNASAVAKAQKEKNTAITHAQHNLNNERVRVRNEMNYNERERQILELAKQNFVRFCEVKAENDVQFNRSNLSTADRDIVLLAYS